MTGPRITLLGANGQVGWELQRALQPLGTVTALGREQAPLDQPAALLAALDASQPHIVVNAAAYTAVDKAQSEPEQAHAINAVAPAHLGAWAAKRHALVVHYSTDYVFDGSGEHFRTESDPTQPLSVYGATKLAGEQALQASGCAALIFRTSWVYAARGGNFAKTMLRLAHERDQLSVVGDQWGAPTGADLIADTSAHCIAQLLRNPDVCIFDEKLALSQRVYSFCCYENNSKIFNPQLGVFHLVADGATTWHAYASAVIEAARTRGAAIRVSAHAVAAIASSAYPTPAKRPLNSRLSTHKLQARFGLHLPHWQVGVQRLVEHIC